MQQEVKVKEQDSAKKILRQLQSIDKQVEVIVVSQSFWRGFSCTLGCTACCLPITLDFIPSEFSQLPQHIKHNFSERRVEGKLVMSVNKNFIDSKCLFLENDRCTLYPFAPLSCMSAPQIQPIYYKSGTTYIMKKPFSRGWLFPQTPQCKFFTSPDAYRRELRELHRFKTWAEYFEYNTAIDEIISCIEQGWGYGRSVVVWKKVDETILRLFD